MDPQFTLCGDLWFRSSGALTFRVLAPALGGRGGGGVAQGGPRRGLRWLARDDRWRRRRGYRLGGHALFDWGADRLPRPVGGGGGGGRRCLASPAGLAAAAPRPLRWRRAPTSPAGRRRRGRCARDGGAPRRNGWPEQGQMGGASGWGAEAGAGGR